MKKLKLIELIKDELYDFKKINYNNKILPNSVPIVWFGNVEKYLESNQKIITVSLNPSDIEFKNKKSDTPSVTFRFPKYDGTAESLYLCYNDYFLDKPYDAWFKASFDSVLKSFNASHYDKEINTAIHTDIASSYATSPTWSKLTKEDKISLEGFGLKSWHNLIKILEPDIILFSASKGYEKKINFSQIGKWVSIDVDAKTPLLKGRFKISDTKVTHVLFQVQGRKPFLQTSKDKKLEFYKHL